MYNEDLFLWLAKCRLSRNLSLFLDAEVLKRERENVS